MQLNYIEIEQFDVTYKSSSLIPNTVGFFSNSSGKSAGKSP